MSPLLDQLLVGLAIFSALGYFAFRFFRQRTGKSCGSGCCSSAKDRAIEIARRNSRP
jgi:hypothetical protein